MHNFNKDHQKFFKDNGFLIIKNFFKKNLIKNIQKTILEKSHNYIGLEKEFKNFYDKSFHKSLINLKKQNPERFGSLYDSVQKSLSLYSLILDKKLISKISILSRLSANNISFNGENIRMDLPYDKFHNVDWHQDRAYYFQNREGEKGLVCWIPLINIKKNLGPLRVCAKSHKDGFIRDYKKYRKKNSSTQRKIKINKKYKVLNSVVNEGDILFISKNTIHASGKNTSHYIRFSLQVRIHDLMDQNYLSFRNRIIYNQSDIKKMKKKGINISDIENYSI